MDLSKLDNLSEEERQLALKILKEYSKEGKSKDLDNLLYDDYEEIPVSIDEFLHNPKYLGAGLINEEGKFTLYPYWENMLNEIYPDPLGNPTCNTLALTGSIGIGKSTIAVIIMIYELYRMMCLKDPYLHYGLQPIDLITFAVLNITMDAAKGVAWSKLQSLIQSSQWFMERGTVSRSEFPEWRPPKGIELIYGSQSRHILGRAVFASFIDEISFQQNKDVEKQKEKAGMLVNTAAARMQSRFMKGEVNPTILCIASSKRTEQSFMESFIETKKKIDSKTTRVVDEPQWVIRTDKNSDRKFKVAVGNKFLSNELLPLNISEKEERMFVNRGYKIIEVPMGYYENFLQDIDIALTDIAGISTTNISKYINGQRLQSVKKDYLQNPFNSDIIEVGNAPDDKTQYYDFFDMNKIDKDMLSRPMFIHLDMSLSGDKTGIAGIWIKGKKPHQEGVPDSRELYYQLAFSVSVKAPRGYQVSFEKNRQFIYWLKDQGFRIRGISSDTFQSADLLQALKARNYDTEIVSVDRITDNVCLPYQYFKNTIYEERIEMYDSKLLTEEILGLERNNTNGRIDHPDMGKSGSKDASDAVCGAIWNASKHAEEFAFDYGETIEHLINVNNSTYNDNSPEQLTVNFEQELMKAFDTMHEHNEEFTKRDKDNFKDFGLGKAQVLDPFYLANGIII